MCFLHGGVRLNITLPRACDNLQALLCAWAALAPPSSFYLLSFYIL